MKIFAFLSIILSESNLVIRIVEQPEVAVHHDLYQLFKFYFRNPAEFVFGFGRVAEQLFDLGRTEVPRVDADDGFAGGGIDTTLVHALAAPLNSTADMRE